VPTNFILATFPAYILLWITSLWLNGAYDQPYRPLRVVRGMIIGSVMILAYYGLLDAFLRYSRGLIMLSGVVGTVVLLGLHEALYRLGILRFIPYDDEQRKGVIAGDGAAYQEAAQLLRQVPAAPALTGRIAIDGSLPALGTIEQLDKVLYTAGIGEVIFCMDSLSYTSVLQQMQRCGPAYDYKIHLQGSRGFVGSNSSHAAGDLYMTGRRYALASFSQQRNKRVFDIAASLGIMATLPVLLLVVKSPDGLLKNMMHVLVGQKTWVGYDRGGLNASQLPPIKPAVVPPYNILPDYGPDEGVQAQLAEDYARRYTPGVDAGFFWRNLRWLGSR
jgi:hypothetical protein